MKNCRSQVPNLFTWATSELSQDAFLAWFLEWSDKKWETVDPRLRACAARFVQSLIRSALGEKVEVESVEVRRQWERIDVAALVNGKYFIVVEDKTGTSEHSNQLERYAEAVKKAYGESGVTPVLIYFKMQEQGDLSGVEHAGYARFTRGEMLAVLKKYCDAREEAECNEILCDYYRALSDLDDRICSYKTLPLTEWDWWPWQGFYSALQKKFPGAGWGYVPNPSGGFLGFWWGNYKIRIGSAEADAYLQLEEERLVFKLASDDDKDAKRAMRDAYRKALFEVAGERGISIERHGRLGTWMSVAKLSGDYRVVDEQKRLDLDATVVRLRQAEDLLSKAVQNMGC